MWWALAVRSIAITASLAVLGGDTVYAEDVDIKGDCNVVAPSAVNQGAVSYTINCNNISQLAGDQIERILRLIEQMSRSTPAPEFESVLAVLMRNSEANLEEIRKTKSPHIELSKRIFNGCERNENYDCFDDVELINDGGYIERLESIDVLETAYVQYTSGSIMTGTGEFLCPFGNYGPFHADGMTIDYEEGGYSFAAGQSRNSGEVVGTVQMSNRYAGHHWFEKNVIQNYNQQRMIRLGDAVDPDILRACLNFTYVIGIKVSLRNYSGNIYEQFFVLGYEPVDDELVRLVDEPFQQGPKGYEEFRAGYYAAKESRKTGNGETVNFSVLANFLLDRSGGDIPADSR